MHMILITISFSLHTKKISFRAFSNLVEWYNIVKESQEMIEIKKEDLIAVDLTID